MSEKKLSFEERVALMRAAAEDLQQIAEIVAAEAALMAGAAERFAAKKTARAN
jgi:hypothetical protein